VISSFAFPLQGLCNFLVYIFPRYCTVRKSRPNLCCCSALVQAIWNPSWSRDGNYPGRTLRHGKNIRSTRNLNRSVVIQHPSVDSVRFEIDAVSAVSDEADICSTIVVESKSNVENLIACTNPLACESNAEMREVASTRNESENDMQPENNDHLHLEVEPVLSLEELDQRESSKEGDDDAMWILFDKN
jgi:hypothetical protein